MEDNQQFAANEEDEFANQDNSNLPENHENEEPEVQN